MKAAAGGMRGLAAADGAGASAVPGEGLAR